MNTPNIARPQSKPMTHAEQQCVRLFPCDGVRRYVVKGLGRASVTYSAAYEGLFIKTHCRKTEDGGRIFTHEAIKRIGNLNGTYLRVAHEFVTREMHRENVRMAAIVAKLEADAAAQPVTPVESTPNTKPEPEPDHDLNPQPAKL